MNRILIFLLLCTCTTMAFSQQERKEFKLIIEIDEQLPISGIMGAQLMVTGKNDSVKTLLAGYDPGTLRVNDKNAAALIDSAKQIILSFYYVDPANDSEAYSDYKIAFKKEWLTSKFCVLRVYNLDKKKYKKSYDPLSPSQNYNFSIDFPDYQMMPITKR
jgi:hypothetical protein